MSALNKAKDLNDEANAKAQSGAWREARTMWLQARALDDTWAIPSFNLARNYLDNTTGASDVLNAERFLDEAEFLANKRKHSEDRQVIMQLPQMRQWLRHKKNKFQMI